MPPPSTIPKAPARAPLDWARLASLRLRARAVAEGVYAGVHPSTRKGSGVEFGGHRPYVAGDDLRLLDRRAMARHDKPFIRELQTETDRALRLVVDASASMGFRGERARATKLEYASMIAAALARIALASGDPVALDFIAGERARSLPQTSGRESFERLVSSLDDARASGDASSDPRALDLALGAVARRARRGSVLVLLSDLIDVHPDGLRRYTALATGGRTLLAVRVLDPDEASFPFEGPVRLRSVEREVEVETDPGAVRAPYLAALAAIAREWTQKLAERGGRLLVATSSDDPVEVVRSVLRAAAEGSR